MTSKYEAESLLRPPVEYYAAIAYGVASVLLVIGSEWFLLPPIVAFTFAALCGARAVMRYREASRIVRYQKGLLVLQMFTMSSKQLPVSNYYQYLGNGFEWDQRHAQRIYEFNLSKNKIYRTQAKGYTFARNLEVSTEHRLPKLSQFLRSQSKYNPYKPLPPIGGDAHLHGVGMWEGEKRILMDLGDRVGHTIVVGTTRVGKTRLGEIIIAQDIHRGDVVIVFDPKGDADLPKRMYSEAVRAGREDQFYMFHLGFPEQSASYNPVGSFMRVTEVASRIARQMPGEGQSLAFREFVWGYVNVVAKLMNRLGIKPTYSAIKSYSEDIEPLVILFLTSHFDDHRATLGDWREEVERTIEILRLKVDERPFDFDFRVQRHMHSRTKEGLAMMKLYKDNVDKIGNDIAHSAIKAFQMDSVHMGKLIASLDPFLEKMTTGAVADLIAPDYQDLERPVFDWNDVIQQGGIVYVGLDALSDSEVAAAVGNSMFADLTSIAGRLYKHGRDHGLPEVSDEKKGYSPKICIHADEFNELAGDEFIPMLNKAGGAGIQVTAYTQTLSDIEAKVGVKAKAQQMLGNFNTVIMLRILEQETAEFVVKRQAQVVVEELKTYSNVSENSNVDSDQHYSSGSQTRQDRERVDLVQAADLMRLPKGQAFAWLDGNKVHKIRIPLPDDSDLENIPDNLQAVADQMKSQYQTASVTGGFSGFRDHFDPIRVLNQGAQSDQYGHFVQGLSLDSGYLPELETEVANG